MSKADRYTKKTASDDIESIEQRLSMELRNRIRQLNYFELYSPQWCEMAETCGHIAAISDIELSLSASKSEGTLWETEEQALRFLTEGKRYRIIVLSFRTYYRVSQRQLNYHVFSVFCICIVL